MRKTSVLVVSILLACPAFAVDQSKEQKRLAICGQVFKEIMDIPDGFVSYRPGPTRPAARGSDSEIGPIFIGATCPAWACNLRFPAFPQVESDYSLSSVCWRITAASEVISMAV